MFEGRKYTNETADWGYEDMLGFYKSGAISADRMSEYIVIFDAIEAEHLAKKAKMDAKDHRQSAKTTKNIAA